VKDPSGGRGAGTRAALLRAGERLLALGGFETLTTTAVAAEAGVSTGAFYGHFADKHALLLELFAERLDDLTEGVTGVLTADRLLDVGLHQTLAAAVDEVVAGYRAHAPVLRAALARVPVRDDLRAVYWERHGHAVDVLERFVRRGQRAGLVRAGPAPVLAHAALVLTQGLNHPVVLGGDGDLAADVRSELTRALTALLAA
jgi:TetR/AcrR family transcriptional regulator, ethionamide resistance regulator